VAQFVRLGVIGLPSPLILLVGRRGETARTGCSADQAYFQGRQCAVENTRVANRRVVQRHVLYLGEINDTQELAGRRSIELIEEGAPQPRTLSLFRKTAARCPRRGERPLTKRIAGTRLGRGNRLIPKPAIR
jgi:hypothetical protein